MTYLVDTNILVRLVDIQSSQHQATSDAIKLLLTKKQDLYIIYESLIEFWVVATRDKNDNGLGLSTDAADKEIFNLLKVFLLLPDASLFAEWRALVNANHISGYKAYDTRLVAAMNLHSIDALLTFNDADFKYYGIRVETPTEVLAKP
ncbi:MAG: PIN domain-containing protein [Acidobacteriota bacterium]